MPISKTFQGSQDVDSVCVPDIADAKSQLSKPDVIWEDAPILVTGICL